MYKEFYPTPASLLDKITVGMKWGDIRSILEPSAGRGDILDYIQNKYSPSTYRIPADMDCIEINADLRHILMGKGYRVVHDDFLTFNTYKQYDLIIMNPPFSNGAAHLMKALEMQKHGGCVLCIVNAETLRNPYTNERKVLVKKLEDLNADIQYMSHEFSSAERKTDVEIAVIKVIIPVEEKNSVFFEEMKKKHYIDLCPEFENTEVAVNDYIRSTVTMYEIEVEAGIRLIEEYRAMKPHILSKIEKLDETDPYNYPILELKLGKKDVTVNNYVKCVRHKYWSALFNDPRFTGKMPSEMLMEYQNKVDELIEYDFSLYNIKTMQVDMSLNLIRGIEDCIVKLFDELSYQYSYSDELSKNIHYYNGWKTNKAWIINKKVILPFMNAWDGVFNDYDPTRYKLLEKLVDIEKALNYLDGGVSSGVGITHAMQEAKRTGKTKKIWTKYFLITFYKKGTCHIEFTNLDLLKKLNIFGAQSKRWLPPAYGKKKYEEMQEDEKKVVDEFEGKESYRQTLDNAAYFIYDPASSLKMLETE